MRNSKKGFTIVELIIVIAVIAVLAAVLIPTFSNLIQKANVAADQTLIKNLNTALAMDTTVSKHETMTQALEATKANGFDVEKIVARATDNKIVWDSVNDCFAYIEKGKQTPTYIPDTKTNPDVKDYQLWTIVNNTTLDKTYSSYIAGTSVTGAVEATKGVDVGENTGITAVTYKNETETAQTVVIRTNSTATALEINASKDTVKHYDAVGTVKVIAVDRNSSYHEFGTANTLIVNDGHIVVENNATVENIIVEKTENATVSLDNNGEVVAVAGADNSVTINGVSEEKKIETKTELTADGGYVKLTSAQEISSNLTISKDTVLDLNGQTLTIDVSNMLIVTNAKFVIMDSSSTSQGKIVKDGAKSNCPTIAVYAGAVFTLNGGTIDVKDLGYGNGGYYSPIVNVRENATANINGGKIISSIKDYSKYQDLTNAYSNSCVWVGGKNATVNMAGGELYNYEGIALSGNGANANGTVINITGGRLISKSEKNPNHDGCAIYHPQDGVMTISGGYIEGDDGINVKSGKISISGGTIVGTVDGDGIQHNNDGSVKTGAGISITSANNYSGNMAIDITGGTIKSKSAYAVMELIPKNSADKVLANGCYVNYIKILGGSFESAKGYEQIFVKEAFDRLQIVSGYTVKHAN